MGIGIKQRAYKTDRAIFITSHGVDNIKSVSISPVDSAGQEYDYVEAGQIVGKANATGLFYPHHVERAQGPSVGSGVVVTDATKFRPGMVVYHHNGEHFLIVESVDLAAESVKFTEGDPIKKDDLLLLVSDYVSSVSTKGFTSSSGETIVSVADGTKFRSGQKVSLQTSAGLQESTVTKVSGNDVTISGDHTTLAIGSILTSAEPLTEYRIVVESVKVKGETNILAPTRDHGRVNTNLLIGYYSGLDRYFPQVTFDTI